MRLEEKIKEISENVKRLIDNENFKKENALAENCYFCGEDIVCFARENGDSRYPYDCDGLTLWASSAGYFSAHESDLQIILPSCHGKEPFAAFWGGVKNSDGYIPVSLTELTKQSCERNISRYTVYTHTAAYHFVETPQALFVLRTFVTDKKEICFSLCAQNKTEKPIDIYLASYLNCFIGRSDVEGEWSHLFKKCAAQEGGFIFERNEGAVPYYATVSRAVSDKTAKICSTASRSDFTGTTTTPLNCAESLVTGKFKKNKPVLGALMTDTAAAGDMVFFSLNKKAFFCVDYKIKAQLANLPPFSIFNANDVDMQLKENERLNLQKHNSDGMLRMEFKEWKSNEIKAKILNGFLNNVVKQVDFGAMAKNFAGPYLGVRDIFQILESALVWNPEGCRTKIIEVLGFIDISGRPPRQFAYPANVNVMPNMDIRAFIDQGLWIINTLFSYLSYTSDYSILDEVCGYYDFSDGKVKASDLKETVLDHLLRITDYLIKNIDTETKCLKILFGDWNDALDGLGHTDDAGKSFGTGVSVMASLQFYQNLAEMSKILDKIGNYKDLIEKYNSVRENLKQGLAHFALEKNDKGQVKILHGWGDKRKYTIGGFCDCDGFSRDTLTANAFWVIAGAFKWDDSIKQTILDAYQRLDSNYGLMTFKPHFDKGAKGSGRIAELLPGTAENGATYIHATIFGIASLFMMGESEAAWEQLIKILPITHKMLSTTPFVMSNSYMYNAEYGIDGESISDWYTGSANTLLKVLVKFVFGINPDLNGLKIQPAKYLPAEGFNINIKVKNAVIEMKYVNKNTGYRKILVNDKEISLVYDAFMDNQTAYIPSKDLCGKMKIEVID